MKKTLLLASMFISATSSFANGDLSLACIGNKSYSIQKTDGDYSYNVEENSSESYIFNKRKLIKKIGNINCKWSEESINCSELGRQFGNGTIHRNININRITGAVSSFESHQNSDGVALIIQEFNGICKSQKMKF
jgi:hypothetical protein